MKRTALLLLMAALAFAGELTGKWSGTFIETDGPGGAETNTTGVYMDLKVSGQTVTGTAGPDEARQFPISGGKLDGKKLTFEVSIGPAAAKFDLVFDGNTIKGTAASEIDGQHQYAKLDLKRKQ